VFLAVTATFGAAQSKTYERSFAQSPAAVQTTLGKMQSVMSGHLPLLDGFAIAGERSFDRYQKAYFQATAQVSRGSTGKSIVRISVKVTAWYSDPAKTHSGYELLQSNGRIENDILDQLAEELGANQSAEKESAVVASNSAAVAPKAEAFRPAETKETEPAISAPEPRLFDTPSVSSSLSRGLVSAATGTADGTPSKPPVDPERKQLQAEIAQLQDVLKNQAHPKNMAAVRKSGTAVVSSPSLSSKPMFMATAHDEFEVLNYNQDWVHVRISGLSRGWIWRNDLEMPDSIPDAPASAPSPRAAEYFHVVREETTQFPGDWEPLRGKNVKLISVQKIDESAKDSGSQLKLEFAKSIFEKSYAEMNQKPDDLAGIVLIFDSADGGMIAVSQPTLAKWKSGVLSDLAFWRSCYFDPPETFPSGGHSASQ
jgi:hypothetical protein